jgi:hypothetical protein
MAVWSAGVVNRVGCEATGLMTAGPAVAAAGFCAA